ncbi:MAG: DUF6362 family protein [Geminicoccaceae bacterium]
MTPDELEARLQDAVTTLANLPGGHPGPKMPRSAWPEVLQSYFDAYGSMPARSRRSVPASEAIDDMDEVLGWLSALRRLPAPSDAERKLLTQILWARAHQTSWQMISDRLRAHGHRMSGKTVQRRHAIALACLARIATRPQGIAA